MRTQLFNNAFLTDVPFGPEDFRNKIFPSGIWPFVVQFAVLIVIILIIVYLFYKPIKKMLNTRAEHVRENIQAAEISKKEMEEKLSAAEKEVESKRLKAQAMIKETIESSEKMRQQMLTEAKLEVEKERARALSEIELAKTEALDEIHQEIVEVALDASKKVLEREVSEKDNRRIIEDFIKEVKEE